MKKPKLESIVKKEEPPTDDDDVDLEDDDDWQPEISAPTTNSHPAPKKSGKDKPSAASKKVRLAVDTSYTSFLCSTALTSTVWVRMTITPRHCTPSKQCGYRYITIISYDRPPPILLYWL